MSSFQENFKKDEGEKLSYDDAAFYYYLFAVSTLALVPLSIYILIEPLYYGE